MRWAAELNMQAESIRTLPNLACQMTCSLLCSWLQRGLRVQCEAPVPSSDQATLLRPWGRRVWWWISLQSENVPAEATVRSREVLWGEKEKVMEDWFCLFHKHDSNFTIAQIHLCTVTAGNEELIAQKSLLFSGQVLFELQPEKCCYWLEWQASLVIGINIHFIRRTRRDFQEALIVFFFLQVILLFVIWFKWLALLKSCIKNQELKLAERLDCQDSNSEIGLIQPAI